MRAEDGRLLLGPGCVDIALELRVKGLGAGHIGQKGAVESGQN